jgi:hypothetical protein
MNQIYFTVIPTPHSGFTDQLNQFVAFYKLGKFLEYSYVHTTFTNHRSSPKIYELLGINQLFAQFPQVTNFIAEYNETRFVELILTTEVLEENNIQEFIQLKNYIVNFVKVQTSHTTNEIFLIKFISPIQGRKAVFITNFYLTKLPEELDFYSAYQTAKKQQQRPPAFPNSGKLKVLVHIRQGDTAVIEIPGRIYISLWKQHFPKTIYLNKLDDSFLKIIEPEEYYYFLTKCLSFLNEKPYISIISSDGYYKSFKKLSNILTRRMSLLFDWLVLWIANIVNKQKFDVFNKMPDAKLVVGETDDKLITLIDATLSANIIIVGTQQGMIPKLLSLYPKTENKPILVNLYKTENKPYYSYLESSLAKMNMTDFNLVSGDYALLVTEIAKYLDSNIDNNY